MDERPHYGLSAEDCDILNEEYRAEQAAADEEAELTYRRMLEDEETQAERAADDAQADAHQDMPPTVCDHDIF